MENLQSFFLRKILICIVVYEQNLASSSTFQTIANIASESEAYTIYFYDNSPLPQSLYTLRNEYKNIEFYYIHDPSNPGVSKAYNLAADFALLKGKKYLLFFDQDSKIPTDFFEKLTLAIADHPSIHLFVPVVKSYSNYVSPGYSKVNRKKYNPYKAAILPTHGTVVINSGMMVSVRAFMDVGKYSEDLPFYFSDSYFFYKFEKKYAEFALYDSTIEHDMCFCGPNSSKILARLESWRLAYKKFLKMTNNRSKGIYFYRMVLGFAFKFRKFSFVKYMFQCIFKNSINYLLSRLA